MNSCNLYLVTVQRFVVDNYYYLFNEINMNKETNDKIFLAQDLEFRLLADYMTDLIAVYSTDGVLEYISPSVKKILGYDPNDLIGIKPTKYIHPDDAKMIDKSYQEQTYKNNESFVAEYRLLSREGKWVYFSTIRKPLRNNRGRLEQIVATCRDITDRIEAKKAIARNETYYRILADNILDMVALHNPDGVFEYVSPSSLNVLGYSPEELIGLNAFSFVHPEEANALYENNRELAAEGRDTFINEFRIRHKDGHYIFFETTTKIIRNVKGEATNFLTTSRDITQWKLDQFALKESEEKYRSLIESSGNIISMVDYESRYLFVNKIAADFIGLSAQEIIGKKLIEVSRSSNIDFYVEQVQKVIAEGKAVSFESPLHMKEKDVWLRVAIEPVKNSDGKVYAALINSIDITNMVNTERKLEEQNKELREIAFVQSHLVRAPLANIQYLISLCNENELSGEQITYLRLLKESAQNLDNIITTIVERSNAVRIQEEELKKIKH